MQKRSKYLAEKFYEPTFVLPFAYICTTAAVLLAGFAYWVGL